VLPGDKFYKQKSISCIKPVDKNSGGHKLHCEFFYGVSKQPDRQDGMAGRKLEGKRISYPRETANMVML
jgi:hypothetical protein